MNPIYTTETPIIATDKYHFDYPSKRDAYIDACYSCLSLNQAAKTAPDNYRHYIYRLKVAWLRHLYQKSFCVQAYEDYSIWHFKFKVDGIVFAWHLPDKVVTWPVKETRGALRYEWQDDMSPRTRSLEESIALLEWCLS